MSGPSRSDLRIVDEYWAQLAAVDGRLLREARAAEARRRLARTLAFALLALLLAAGVAVAARAIFGSDAPPRFPGSATVNVPLPGPGALLAPRVADPAGGAPWGMRVIDTADGKRCLQVGRVVEGRLSSLGVAGEFGDDGLAHALPVEAHACTAAVPASRGVFAVQTNIETTAAVAEGAGCRPSDVTQGSRAGAPPCAAADERTVVAGLAGANAVEVSIDGSDGVQRQKVAPSEGGPFVFVLRGRPPAADGRISVKLASGLECPVFQPIGQTEDRRTPTVECNNAVRGG